MASILDRLVQLESEISYQVPPLPDEPEFQYIPGSLPVLCSAPHGAVHTRDGEPKFEDEYTAAFARLIAEETGAHVLYAHHRSNTDPNWYADVPYKQKLAQILTTNQIRFVLDIHGAAARREFGLALGTMSGRSCPDQRDLILKTLSEHGFARDHHQKLYRLDIDQTFSGAGSREHETVIRFASQRLRVPAAQFELNAYLRIVHRKPDASLPRPFHGNPDQIEKVVLAFLPLVQRLAG